MIVLVRFRVKPDRSEAFLARVRRQAEDSLRLEEACRRFDVATAPGDPTQVLLYEIYDDAAAFDLHLASDHFKAFDAEVREWLDDKVVERWAGPLA